MISVEYKHTFKFIVVGSSGVGKTSLINRLITGTFSHETNATVGVDYLSTVFDIDGSLIKLQIWDTAGHEKFRSITKSYFRHAVGVILVFDVNERKSFDDLSYWLNDIHSLCDPNACITLIGNKIDLESTRIITTSEAMAFGNTHNLNYIETSAKVGDNVKEAFYRAAKSAFEKAEQGILSIKINNSSSINSNNHSNGCSC